MEHSSQELYEMRALIKGTIQGVGFRANTRHYAMKLGLKGTVRNLDNGSVEIYAQGSKRQLEELIKRIRQEAGFGQVQEVMIDYFPIENPHEDFQIIY